MVQTRLSSRAVLLILLVPILLYCGWVAKQDLFYPVLRASVSADGRYLLTVHSQTRTFEPPSDPAIRLWDLQTGQLLRQLRCDAAIAIFSCDGRMVAVGRRLGIVSVLDSQTLQELKTIATQESSVFPLQFTQDDKHLLLDLNKYKSPGDLRLVNVASGEISDNRRTSFFPTANGRDLFLELDVNEIRVVHFESGKFVQRYSHTFASPVVRSTTMTPDGSLVAAVLDNDGHAAIWRPEDDDVLAVTLGASNDWFIQFLDGNQLLAVCDYSGNVTLWDWRDQRRVGGWATSNQRDLRPVWSPHHQERALVYSDQPLTVYNLLDGKIIATLPMRLSTYLVLLGIATAVFVIWTILWIRTGMRSERRWPTLDLAVVHGAVLSLLLVRFLAADSRQDIGRPIVVIAWAEFVALLSLAGLWFSHGTHRWPIRTAGLIGMTAFVGALVAISWRGEAYIVWQAAVGMISFGLCLVTAFRVLKWMGVCIGRNVDDVAIQTSLRKSQITLRDILLLATAASAFFASARLLKADHVTTWVMLFLVVNGATYALAATTAVWTALSHRSLILRAILFLALSGIAGWLPTELFRHAPILISPAWWYLTAHVLMAILVLVTLVVFRGYGRAGSGGSKFICVEN